MSITLICDVCNNQMHKLTDDYYRLSYVPKNTWRFEKGKMNDMCVECYNKLIKKKK